MSTPSNSLHVSILTSLPDLGTWLCEDIGCESKGEFQVATVANRKLSFSVASTPDEVGQAPVASIPVALLRFVDVVTLQNTLDLLESNSKIQPAVVLIYRNENETDFKMSCPYCGQKLWVRDADQDKSGRCPHCHKGFSLPAQDEHVTSALSLPPNVPVYKIVRGDPGSLALPLQKIVEAEREDSALKRMDKDSILKSKTMKVDVED